MLLFRGTTTTTNSDFGLIYRNYNLIIIDVNESDIQAAFIMFLQLSQISQTVNVSLYRVAGMQRWDCGAIRFWVRFFYRSFVSFTLRLKIVVSFSVFSLFISDSKRRLWIL